MRILLTGASGFVGRPLLDRLATSHEVWVAGRRAAPGVTGVRYVEWDLSASIPTHDLPSSVDAVVHLAQSREYRRFPDRALAIARVNLQATLELLDYASAAGATRFVFASSGGIYGGSDRPIKEDARVGAPDFYLATKLAGETLAAAYRSRFDVVTLRLFFVYGPGQAADRFFTELVRRVLSGEPVILYGADGMRLNPIHVADAVRAIDVSLGLQGSHVINVGGPDVLTLRRMSELIAVHVRRDAVFDQRPADPARDLVADIGLMRRVLGAPTERFEQRIGEVCDEAMAAMR